MERITERIYPYMPHFITTRNSTLNTTVERVLRMPLKAKSRTSPMARTNWADTPCRAAAST